MSKGKMIKLPESKSKSKRAPRVKADESIVVTRYTAEADKLITNKTDLDGAKKQLDAVRRVLEPIAKTAQLEAEREGNFATKVLFQGSKQRACFTFTNSFGALNEEAKGLVEGAIGDEPFDALFEESQSMRVRSDKLQELRDAVEAAGLDPSDFFVTETVYAPVNEFRRTRFEMRGQLSEEQNEVLDSVTDQLGARPSLTVK
jgi:G3E family GTPase